MLIHPYADLAMHGLTHMLTWQRMCSCLQVGGEAVEAPHALPWYPNKLAWQFNFSRSQVWVCVSVYGAGACMQEALLIPHPSTFLDANSHACPYA